MQTELEQIERNVGTAREPPIVVQPPSGPSGNFSGFLSKCCGITLAASLVIWLILLILGIIAIIPLTQLIVGSVHKDECPINPKITTYLIVAGVVGIMQIVLQMVQNLLGEAGNCCYLITAPLGLFSFAWFITGSVWVFQAHSKVQFNNPGEKSTYCNPTAFNCAFVTLIISYVLICIWGFCGGVSALFGGRNLLRENNEPITEAR